MLANRSIPSVTVIPVLYYPALDEAVAWLCDVVGFSERLRIGGHRVQLTLGGGALVAAQGGADASGAVGPGADHSIMVRVDDVDAHFARVRDAGGEIVQPPATHPYGERQYSMIDPGGHRWTFSQSVADVDPAEWGGLLVAAGSAGDDPAGKGEG